jgi:hypothetical protein
VPHGTGATRGPFDEINRTTDRLRYTDEWRSELWGLARAVAPFLQRGPNIE